MRILHVVRRFEPLVGGTERYVGDLARAQARAGHAVTIATLDRDVTGVYPGRLRAEELVGPQVRVVRLPGIGTRRFAATLRPDRLFGLVREAEVVHLHDLRFHVGLVSVLARCLRRPAFLHTHGLIFHTPAWRRLKRLAFRLYYGPILAVTRMRVLASSDVDVRLLREIYPQLNGAVVLVPNGVELNGLFQLHPTPEPGRIVAIGRVARSKGLDLVLRALKELPDGRWTLEINGAAETEERARLLAVARGLDIESHVHFHGHFDQALEPSLLARASVAVFASRAEGFGIALLDAMAAGVPLVASDIPAHRLLLGDESIHLVDWRNSQDAAAKLAIAMALNPAERAKWAADLRALAIPYSVDRVVRTLDRLYAEPA